MLADLVQHTERIFSSDVGIFRIKRGHFAKREKFVSRDICTIALLEKVNEYPPVSCLCEHDFTVKIFLCALLPHPPAQVVTLTQR